MEFREHVPLAPYTTFGIGGPARWFADASTENDIVEAATFAREAGVPLFALGGGSNLLVSDAGYDGLVLRIALRGIDERREASRRIFDVAAGEDWDGLVTRTVAENCAGIECLAGIPGSTGGTPVQNVGAYGQEVAQTITLVRCYDLATGVFIDWPSEQCGFAYRTSRFNREYKGRFIVTRVSFSLAEDGEPSLQYADLKRYFENWAAKPSLGDTSTAVRLIRKRKGMVLMADDPDSRSAGSFFKNPIVPASVYERIAAAFAPSPIPHYPAPDRDTSPDPGQTAPGGEDFDRRQIKLPAAWLLENAGFHRGYARGNAGISSRHTLALINRGGATAADILSLRDEIVTGVQESFGVLLEPEPVWLGT